MTRIIDWDKERQDEYEKLRKASNSGLSLIDAFADSVVETPILDKCVLSINLDDETQLAKDLLDLWTGDAKFPEQKYYVKLLDKEEGYLNCQKSFNDYFVNNNKDDDSDYQTQFTISEIEAIDPRYKAFAIPVEDE